MKRMNLDSSINLGGHKRSVNDLETLQGSIDDICQAIGLMLGNSGSAAVLSELEIEDLGATYNLNKPASVFYNGKLYRVNSVFGAAKGGVGSEYKFEITTTPLADNPVTYQSGASFNVHIEEEMELRHTNASGAQYLALSAVTASEWITFPTTALTNLTVAGGGEYCRVKYRVLGKTLFCYVAVVGQLTGTSFAIPLPNGYKTKEFVRLPVAMYANLDGVGAKQFNTFFAIADGFGSMLFQNGGTVYDLPEYDPGAINFATTFVIEIE